MKSKCTQLFAHSLDKLTLLERTGNTATFKCPKCGFTETLAMYNPSREKRMSNLSPEEVMSGAQYGVKTEWGKAKSKRDWGEEQREQLKDVREALS